MKGHSAKSKHVIWTEGHIRYLRYSLEFHLARHLGPKLDNQILDSLANIAGVETIVKQALLLFHGEIGGAMAFKILSAKRIADHIAFIIKVDKSERMKLWSTLALVAVPHTGQEISFQVEKASPFLASLPNDGNTWISDIVRQLQDQPSS